MMILDSGLLLGPPCMFSSAHDVGIGKDTSIFGHGLQKHIFGVAFNGYDYDHTRVE